MGIAQRVRRLMIAGAVVAGLAIAAPAAAAQAAPAPALVQDPASLVNPLIGTSGGVNEFPGPDMP